jgi:hypothetical protein
VFEADIPLPNVAHMQTRAARSDREPVDLRRLVAGSCAWLPMWPSSGRYGTAKHSPNFDLTVAAARGVAYRHFGCRSHVDMSARSGTSWTSPASAKTVDLAQPTVRPGRGLRADPARSPLPSSRVLVRVVARPVSGISVERAGCQ